MADRNKVVRELEHMAGIINQYTDMLSVDCDSWVILDALELLKEQEPLSIVYDENPYTGLPVAHCPKCSKFAEQFHMSQYGEETHFCPYCGRSVKWE